MKKERAFHHIGSSCGRRFLSQYANVVLAFSLAAQLASVYAGEGTPGVGIDPAGLAYCQAEDYLWQIEESYIAGLGRASEVNGEEDYKADWNNRLFEVPRSARE